MTSGSAPLHHRCPGVLDEPESFELGHDGGDLGSDLVDVERVRVGDVGSQAEHGCGPITEAPDDPADAFR